MANIVVYIEQNDGFISDCNLKAVNIARKIASQKGAVLYGILATDKGEIQNQQVTSVLSTFKLDKLIVVRGEIFKGPDRLDTSRHLTSYIRQFKPTLIFFGDSTFAREFAPWLAAKFDGTFISDFTADDYNHIVFKEKYPYSNQIFEIEEHFLEKPIVSIIKQTNFENSARLTHMEVKVESITKISEVEFDNHSVFNLPVMDSILILGSKTSSKDIEKLNKIAKSNEWYLATAKSNNVNLPSLSEIPVSGFINRFILWECSSEEALLTSFCWNSFSKVLFVNSDFSNTFYSGKLTVWQGEKSKILRFFETEMF